MINNTIRIEDNVFIVKRILSNTTSEESATSIHNIIGTDSLLRDKDGKWFCCMKVKDAEYRDGELVPMNTYFPVDYTGTEFELGDNGVLG
jgi:hypothetical protein